MWDGFIEWLEKLVQAIVDLLLWIPRFVWDLLLDSLEWVYDAIPVPEFLTQIGSSFSKVKAETLWLVDLFELNTGVAIIVSAYVTRFLIRRIPVIG